MALASPLASPGVAALGLGVALGGWLWLRPPKRELWVAGPALILAAILMLSGLGRHSVRVGDAAWEEVAQGRYVDLWNDLNHQARQMREAFLALRGPLDEGPPVLDLDRLDLDARGAANLEDFARLEELAASGVEGTALLWLDSDGHATAWAGTGLLHELDPLRVPYRGATFIAGFTAVSLLAIEPLDLARPRSKRAVAGRSLWTDQLPFAPPGGEPVTAFRWSLVHANEEASRPTDAEEVTIRLAAAGLPTMLIEPLPGLATSAKPLASFRRQSWAVLGLALLALAVMRTVGLLLAPPRQQRAWLAAALSAVGGVVALGAAAGLTMEVRLALVAAVGLAGLGIRGTASPLADDQAGGRDRGRAIALAAVSSSLVAFGCWAYQHAAGGVDLAVDLIGQPETMALRLAVFGATLGLLGLAAHRPVDDDPASDHWGWASVALILGASMAVDLPWVAMILLLAGGGCAGGWLYGRVLTRRLGSFSVLLLIAVLISGVAWELGFRASLRQRIGGELLAGMSPPSLAEVQEISATLDGFFGQLDLAGLTPRPTTRMEYQDLALAVWKGSPLARPNARSALVLRPEGRAGREVSAFSTGLALTTEHNDYRVEDTEGGIEARVEAWRHGRIKGRVEITADGEPWGHASWWLYPRPGFGLGADEGHAEEILAALLRGEPGGSELPTQLPPSVHYALYDGEGVALVSPWENAPPAPSSPAVEGKPGSVKPRKLRTPDGWATAFSRRQADGQEVLYLPLLRPGQALLRLNAHATGVLLPVLMVTLLALLLALPRVAFRDLMWRTVRSYSKRLALVYSLLLLVPLLLLTLVILRGVEGSQLRVRRDRGEGALRAAQRAIQERLLSSPTGFDVQSLIGDEVRRLPRMIDHEVNLYWGGDFFASSRKELFTAGLLPRRIPGEVIARLAFLRYGVASRLNADFDPPFLELYAPVLPGSDGPDLVVSVPLQAQQEEDAAVLAGLRSRALAYTTALIALLLVVGSRLASNFTRPIKELVEGTRRIALGASSLDLAPSDLELAALVEAVDEMALRIARGRHQLLREKALVEGMVENITPGVVSLDAEYRVLMHNRAAAELLGVQVGDNLLSIARAADRLTPISDMLAATRERAQAGAQVDPARTTIRLPGEDGESQKEWTVVSVPLPPVSRPESLAEALPDSAAPGSLLVVEDVTEMLQGQRLAAWAEMARIIAHEIKNPLTPVRLSAEHMRQVYHAGSDQFPEVFERCISNILTQVDELQQIASEFSTYAHIPRIDLMVGDLRAAMEALIESYLAAPPQGIEILFQAEAEPLPVRFDARLLTRAVRNLLENAVRASSGGGQVVLRLKMVDGRARISVEDTGPGVPAEQLGRIFDPYFSTHDTGTGLGLPIARRIAEEHGGGVSARNRPGGGLAVEIEIPLIEEVE